MITTSTVTAGAASGVVTIVHDSADVDPGYQVMCSSGVDSAVWFWRFDVWS